MFESLTCEAWWAEQRLLPFSRSFPLMRGFSLSEPAAKRSRIRVYRRSSAVPLTLFRKRKNRETKPIAPLFATPTPQNKPKQTQFFGFLGICLGSSFRSHDVEVEYGF